MSAITPITTTANNTNTNTNTDHNMDRAASKTLLADIIATKECNLLASIDLLKEQLMSQFRDRVAHLEAEIEYRLVASNAQQDGAPAIATSADGDAVEKLTHADLIHLLIPFTDYTNKLTTKLGNAYLPRELLFDMCNIVAQHCSAHFNPCSASSAAGSSTAKKPKDSAGTDPTGGTTTTTMTSLIATTNTADTMSQRQRTSKNKFDLICNYSKRKEEQIPNTGTFYDYDLCVYLMSKTFKKSATDAYESFFSLVGGSNNEADVSESNGTSAAVTSSSSFPLLSMLKTTKDLYLGSIGGGPGSDMTGMVAYFYDLLTSASSAAHTTVSSGASSSSSHDPLGDITFHLQIFDIMDINWCASARKPLNKGFMRYLGGRHTGKKGCAAISRSHIHVYEDDTHDHFGCELNGSVDDVSVSKDTTTPDDNENENSVCVQYKHIDLKEPSTVIPNIPYLQKLHFISVCWALNEALFVPEFWHLVLTNTPQAHIIIVEGKDDKLDLIRDMCSTSEIGRAVHYDKYESPRRLIVRPKSQ